ncbi:MAG: hypothetical protein HHAS10_12000 [Candidatus Altimarinota bacterium]
MIYSIYKLFTMNLPQIKFQDDTLTFGGIIGISWDLFTQNFREIITILAIVYIPVDTLLFFLNNSPEISLKEYIRILGYLEQFIGIIATLAIVVLITRKIEKQTISIKQSLEIAIKSWGKVVLANFITGIMIGLLTLLLIVPGVIYGTYWSFITYIILFFGVDGEKARNHSKSLIMGRWWKTFSILLGLFLTPLILGFAISFVYYLVLGLYIVDFDTLSFTGNFIIDMISNFMIDIIGGYFTLCTFILFVAYQSFYGEGTKEKTPHPSEDN